MTHSWPDFMVDTETAGLRADRNHVVEVSVVPFDSNTMEVSSETLTLSFNNEQPGRFFCPETAAWWRKQDPKIAEKVFARFCDPTINNKEQLNTLVRFIINQNSSSLDGCRFWSKPSHFDWNFVDGLCDDFGVSFPVRFYNAIDTGSYMRGVLMARGLSPDLKPYQPKNRQNAHSSLDDCLFQLDWLSNVMLARK